VIQRSDLEGMNIAGAFDAGLAGSRPMATAEIPARLGLYIAHVLGKRIALTAFSSDHTRLPIKDWSRRSAHTLFGRLCKPPRLSSCCCTGERTHAFSPLKEWLARDSFTPTARQRCTGHQLAISHRPYYGEGEINQPLLLASRASASLSLLKRPLLSSGVPSI
jgi:hypothetical protein